MNMGKTKIMVDGLDFVLLKRSGKVPCGVCQKGVGSNAILSCGGCLRWIHKKCSDIKGPYLISGAPYTRAQHSLLNSESGKGWERKA